MRISVSLLVYPDNFDESKAACLNTANTIHNKNLATRLLCIFGRNNKENSNI